MSLFSAMHCESKVCFYVVLVSENLELGQGTNKILISIDSILKFFSKESRFSSPIQVSFPEKTNCNASLCKARIDMSSCFGRLNLVIVIPSPCSPPPFRQVFNFEPNKGSVNIAKSGLSFTEHLYENIAFGDQVNVNFATLFITLF